MFRTIFGRASIPRFSATSAAKKAAFGFAGATAFAGCAAWTVFCDEPANSSKPTFNYKTVCNDIDTLLDQEIARGPLFVRLAWHQAGTWDAKSKDGGANSGSMRFPAECKHAANAGLRQAQGLLEPIKKQNPGISYGDLWSLAAIRAIDAMGGPNIPWRWGRTEAKSEKECPPDGRLPDAALGADHIRQVFNRMGFTDDKEIVALIGAHTLGACHKDRSGYVGPWTHDPNGFDNSFFTELLNNDWVVDKKMAKLQFTDSKTRHLMMLPADMWLIIDPKFRRHVETFAADQDLFFEEFTKAFGRLMELGNHQLNTL